MAGFFVGYEWLNGAIAAIDWTVATKELHLFIEMSNSKVLRHRHFLPRAPNLKKKHRKS